MASDNMEELTRWRRKDIQMEEVTSAELWRPTSNAAWPASRKSVVWRGREVVVRADVGWVSWEQVVGKLYAMPRSLHFAPKPLRSLHELLGREMTWSGFHCLSINFSIGQDLEGPWLERGAHLIGCCNPGQKKEEKVVALINSEVVMERLELIQKRQ